MKASSGVARQMTSQLPRAVHVPPPRPPSPLAADDNDVIKLTVILPDNKRLQLPMQASKPMMDVLVMAAGACHLSPASHQLVVTATETGRQVDYQPSQTLASLGDVTTVYLVPRQQVKVKDRPQSTPHGDASFDTPFEVTQRLTVNLPGGQKTWLRVSLKVTLAQVFHTVCEEKGLDPYRHELRHPSDDKMAVNMAWSLSDYRLHEITLVTVTDYTDFCTMPRKGKLTVTQGGDKHHQQQRVTGDTMSASVSAAGKSATLQPDLMTSSVTMRSTSSAAEQQHKRRSIFSRIFSRGKDGKYKPESVVATSPPSTLSSSRQLSSSASDLHYMSRAPMQIVEFERDVASLHSQRLADANSVGNPMAESAASSRRPSAQSGVSSLSRKKRPAPPPPPPPHSSSGPASEPQEITVHPVQLGASSQHQHVHSRASSHSSGFDEPLARSPDSPADTLKSGISGNLSLRSAELVSDKEPRTAAHLYSEDEHRDTESLDSATLSSTGSRSRKKRPAPVAPANGASARDERPLESTHREDEFASAANHVNQSRHTGPAFFVAPPPPDTPPPDDVEPIPFLLSLPMSTDCSTQVFVAYNNSLASSAQGSESCSLDGDMSDVEQEDGVIADNNREFVEAVEAAVFAMQDDDRGAVATSVPRSGIAAFVERMTELTQSADSEDNDGIVFNNNDDNAATLLNENLSRGDSSPNARQNATIETVADKVPIGNDKNLYKLRSEHDVTIDELPNHDRANTNVGNSNTYVEPDSSIPAAAAGNTTLSNTRQLDSGPVTSLRDMYRRSPAKAKPTEVPPVDDAYINSLLNTWSNNNNVPPTSLQSDSQKTSINVSAAAMSGLAGKPAGNSPMPLTSIDDIIAEISRDELLMTDGEAVMTVECDCLPLKTGRDWSNDIQSDRKLDDKHSITHDFKQEKRETAIDRQNSLHSQSSEDSMDDDILNDLVRDALVDEEMTVNKKNASNERVPNAKKIIPAAVIATDESWNEEDGGLLLENPLTDTHITAVESSININDDDLMDNVSNGAEEGETTLTAATINSAYERDVNNKLNSSDTAMIRSEKAETAGSSNDPKDDVILNNTDHTQVATDTEVPAVLRLASQLSTPRGWSKRARSEIEPAHVLAARQISLADNNASERRASDDIHVNLLAATQADSSATSQDRGEIQQSAGGGKLSLQEQFAELQRQFALLQAQLEKERADKETRPPKQSSQEQQTSPTSLPVIASVNIEPSSIKSKPATSAHVEEAGSLIAQQSSSTINQKSVKLNAETKQETRQQQQKTVTSMRDIYKHTPAAVVASSATPKHVLPNQPTIVPFEVASNKDTSSTNSPQAVLLFHSITPVDSATDLHSTTTATTTATAVATALETVESKPEKIKMSEKVDIANSKSEDSSLSGSRKSSTTIAPTIAAVPVVQKGSMMFVAGSYRPTATTADVDSETSPRLTSVQQMIRQQELAMASQQQPRSPRRPASHMPLAEPPLVESNAGSTRPVSDTVIGSFVESVDDGRRGLLEKSTKPSTSLSSSIQQTSESLSAASPNRTASVSSSTNQNSCTVDTPPIATAACTNNSSSTVPAAITSSVVKKPVTVATAAPLVVRAASSVNPGRLAGATTVANVAFSTSSSKPNNDMSLPNVTPAAAAVSSTTQANVKSSPVQTATTTPVQSRGSSGGVGYVTSSPVNARKQQSTGNVVMDNKPPTSAAVGVLSKPIPAPAASTSPSSNKGPSSNSQQLIQNGSNASNNSREKCLTLPRSFVINSASSSSSSSSSLSSNNTKDGKISVDTPKQPVNSSSNRPVGKGLFQPMPASVPTAVTTTNTKSSSSSSNDAVPPKSEVSNVIGDGKPLLRQVPRGEQKWREKHDSVALS